MKYLSDRWLVMLVTWLAISLAGAQAESVVVFNEIHYHPSQEQGQFEFIELINQNATDIDLSRWSISGGISYVFPPGTILPPGQTLTIASQPESIASYFGLNPSFVFGPWTGNLSNGGERLRLNSHNDRVMDEAPFNDGPPWPIGTDGTGFSLIKRGPNLDSQRPESWTVSDRPGGSPGRSEFSIVPPTKPLASAGSLLAFYPFDTDANDSSGNQRNGSISPTGATLTSGNSGYQGECFRFDGRGYIDIPLPLSPALAPQITVGAWVKINTLSSPARNEVFSTDNGSYDRALTIDTRTGLGDSSTPRYSAFGGANTGVVTGTQARTNDGWVFIAAGFDSIDGQTTLYVNTNRFTSTATHGAASPFSRIGAHPLGIEFFNGWIDNVFVFNRILSSNEIATIRNQGTVGIFEVAKKITSANRYPQKPLLALYPFENNTLDAGTYAMHGITNGSLSYSSPEDGKQGTALRLSGGGVTIPLNLSPSDKPQITLGAWVKWAKSTPPSARHRILSTSSKAYERGLAIDSRVGEKESGTPHYSAPAGDGIGFVPGRIASTNDGWVFCAVVYDAQNASTLLLVDQDIQTSEASQFEKVSNLYIGRNASGTETFQGWLDNVFVFNKALSIPELIAIREGGTQAIFALNVPVLPQDLTTTNLPPPVPIPTLILNELDASPHAPLTVELLNPGSQKASLTNLILSIQHHGTSLDTLLPNQSLEPGAFLTVQIHPPQDGFSDNDPIFLFAPDKKRIIDAHVIRPWIQSRSDPHTTSWYRNTNASPQQPNQPPPTLPVGFNEIQYHAPFLRTDSGIAENPEQWIELHNRGTNTIDLSGWTVTGDIQFLFPSGSRIEPQGFLVLVHDLAAFAQRWPEIQPAGVFSGRLSRSNSRLELITAEGLTADQVHYQDGGRWPTYADGGGSTLELKDPRSHHDSPESWAASDESKRSSWITYTYQGVATQNTGYNVGNDAFHELVLGLLDAGEVLIDDVQVIESPSTNSISFIQNGSFESDSPGKVPARWRLGGNHEALGLSQVIVDPDQPTNLCFRLVATGPTDYLNNHLETTLKNGSKIARITVGREYLISFRAKWIAGTPLLNSRLYFNFLQKTHTLTTPNRTGTPGAPNSRLLTQTGPTFFSITHQPVVPSPSQSVTISTEISDPDGITSAHLHYSVNEGPWIESELIPPQPPQKSWIGTVPPQPEHSRIQFFIEASDATGQSATFPAEGPDSRAMYCVESFSNAPQGVHRMKLIMTSNDTLKLYEPTRRMSNQRRGATLIYDDREVFYNVGLRLKGSAFGRNNDTETGCNIEFDPAQLFRGTHKSIALERSGGGAGREILGKAFFNQAGRGVGSLYDDVTHVQMPRSSDDGLALIALSRNTEEFLDSQWKRGSDGSVWNMDLLYSPNGSVGNDPESPKLNFPYNHDNGQPDIQNLGDDKEAYRWNFTLRNQRDRDDYAPLIRVAKTFELKGDALLHAAEDSIDVDQWLRHFAVLSIVGNIDVYLRYWNHNIRFYQRPEDGRVLVLPWDLDSSFTMDVAAPLWGTSNGLGAPVRFGKVIDLPANSRRFQANLLDLTTQVATPGYITRWASHYGKVTQQDFNPHADWLIQRRRFILSQMARLTNLFRVTTPAYLETTNSPVLITGQAGIEIRSLTINQQPTPTTWSGPSRAATNFTLEFIPTPGTNFLLIQSLNLRGEIIPTATQTLTVVYQGPPPPEPQIRINEWMASNRTAFQDPQDDDYEDWIELYNAGTAPVDLSNFSITDDPSNPRQFVIPNTGRYLIPAKGFLILWADNETQQNNNASPQLHLPFKLAQEGESIFLFSATGSLLDNVQFSIQRTDYSSGRFPDGSSTLVELGSPSPGKPNQGQPNPSSPALTHITLQPNQSIEWDVQTEPGFYYQAQTSISLQPPQWKPLGTRWTGSGNVIRMNYPRPEAPTQFFRILVESQ